ncbi:MAG: hypothetical protein ACI9VI_001045 [Candidatus Azotimanducaceae bacterium]|jgi:hypothetical protein
MKYSHYKEMTFIIVTTLVISNSVMTKNDKNVSTKDGLAAETIDRIAADALLRSSINTISLTPGPQGPARANGAVPSCEQGPGSACTVFVT